MRARAKTRCVEPGEARETGAETGTRGASTAALLSKLLEASLLIIGLCSCTTAPSGTPDAALGPDRLIEDGAAGGDASAGADGGLPSPADAATFALPDPDESLLLGAAGAPSPLFGPEDAPTFSAAFLALRQAGFNRFTPVFLTSETTGTTHWTHFLPPLPGIPQDASCIGGSNAWAALPAGFKVTFPAYLVLLDQTHSSTLAPALARERLTALRAQCLGGDVEKLGEAYLQDEPANNYVSSIFDNDPGTYPLANVHTLADAARATLGRPTFLVEAPIPFLLPHLGVPPGDVPILEREFWGAVDRTTPDAAYYGFDVYPVDLTPDLSVIGEYVAKAKARAPSARPIIVLQGMGNHDLAIPLGTTGRRPTRAETRAMAFSALAAGAQGIYWFGQSATDLADGELWGSILEVVRDLRRLSGVLSLPRAPFTSTAPAIGAAWSSGAQTFVLLANPSSRPVETSLPIAAKAEIFDGLSGARLTALTSTETFALEAYGAQLLVLSPR